MGVVRGQILDDHAPTYPVVISLFPNPGLKLAASSAMLRNQTTTETARSIVASRFPGAHI